jgi:glycosyltransferase involved in cell wall biosynthesis
MNKKTKIVLNAMVGNEAPTIMRMLESVAPHIDYWVIQCNGKEDNTKQVIDEFFKEKNIPGFTYEIDWDYPGWNRDHTLQTCLKADHGCDWVLRMDADERLHVDEDFDWSVLDDTSVDSYNLCAQNGDLKYFRTWFWNAKRPWFFQHDKRHETIHLPEIGENFERRMMPIGFRHLVSQDGFTWAVPRKFLRDALELEIDKVVGNKVLEDYYHLWYIAKSYSDCYGNPDELPFGKMHSDEYARRSIWYYERFLHLTNDWDNSKTAKMQDEMCYFALIMMGQAHKFIGNVNKAVEHFYLAEQFSPTRNEHLMHLCFYLEELNRLEEALNVVNKMLQPERTNPFPNLSFLIEGRAYHDTGNMLHELKDRLTRKLEEPVINLESIKFDFK